jgi:ferritin-like metal-binding protein YciE
MAKVKTLHELLVDGLRDAYHAEKQLTKALPKMAKAATSDELRDALETHLEETRQQIERLEQIFESLEEKAKAKPCAGMQGIIEEGQEHMGEADGDAADASLIASAQKAEHYEIAAYGTLEAWARRLGHEDAANLLQETLDEEKAADERLTELAEGFINAAAESGEREDEEDEDEEGDEAGEQRQVAGPAGRGATVNAADTRRRQGSTGGRGGRSGR